MDPPTPPLHHNNIEHLRVRGWVVGPRYTKILRYFKNLLNLLDPPTPPLHHNNIEHLRVRGGWWVQGTRRSLYWTSKFTERNPTENKQKIWENQK